MDKLKECLNVFKSMMGKDYYITLEGGLIIKVFFARKHFHHLIGLHKLTDIRPVVANKTTNTTTTIFNNIQKGRITYEQISKSSHFSEMSDRIDNFHYTNILLTQKVIINFDKNLVPSAPQKIPDIKAEYILYTINSGNYLHLCLGKDIAGYYYPETYLVHPNDYYVVGQAELTVKSINVVTSGNPGKKRNSGSSLISKAVHTTRTQSKITTDELAVSDETKSSKIKK